MVKKESAELSMLNKQILLDEIRTGIYKNDKRLPPETEIAKHLGVSRNVVRDCLSELEREGFVNRKRGVGTIINRYVFDIKTRMDLADEFDALLRASGYTPHHSRIETCRVKCDEAVAARLDVPTGDDAYCITFLVSADGNNAIFCRDYVAVRTMGADDTQLDFGKLNESIFDFLSQGQDNEIFMDVAEINAVAADDEVAKYLNLPVSAPVLYVEAVWYTFKGKKVFYSQEYYLPGMIKHTIIRKKI